MAWQVFGTLAAGNQNLSLFDTLTGQIAPCVLIPCVATGSNAISLAGTTNAPALSAYSDLVSFSFLAAGNSSGTVTAQFGGLASLNVYYSDGSTQAGSGSLLSGQPYTLTWSQGLNSGAGGFYLGRLASPPPASVLALPQPQGYLTLSSDVFTIVPASDLLNESTVYYSPAVGNICPIYNGSTMVGQVFTQQTMSLVSNHLADTLYDVFAFMNSGAFTIGTGPAWSSSTAGSSSRGTGAGTTQLQRLLGYPVNAVSMTARNGASTFTVAANQGMYLGTIYIDHTAGQTTCHRSWGQNRKWGVWNAYNRVPTALLAGDPTASWRYATATIRAANNTPSSYSGAAFNVGSGTTCNGMSVVCGLAEETINCQLLQTANVGSTTGAGQVLIGFNSTTALSGTPGTFGDVGSSGTNGNPLNVASYQAPPSLGLNIVAALENGNSTSNPFFFGTQPRMVLSAAWRG